MRRGEQEIASFAEAMLVELNREENVQKGGWYGCKLLWLLRRLRQEVGELDRALRTHQPMGIVVSEAADVANFAMMIATNYVRYYDLKS